jgi:hypothetical protein
MIVWLSKGDSMKAFRTLLVSIPCMLVSGLPSADANTMTWSLTDVDFGDGGTASGSFTFDATSGSFSAIDITTTPGTEFGGADYTTFAFGNDLFLTAVTGSSSNLTGTPFLVLNFTSPLTDAGGTIPLGIGSFGSISVEGTCLVANCGSGVVERFVTTGAVSAVPEPTPTPILPSAVALIILFGYDKKRHRTESRGIRFLAAMCSHWNREA